MSESQAIQKRTPTPIIDGQIVVRDTVDLQGLAEYYFSSGLMTQCKNIAQAFVICATAIELRIGFMQAILGIAIINMKPVLHSRLPMALVLRTGELQNITEEIFDRNPDNSIGPKSHAVCVVQRRGLEPIRGEFGMADARAAGLLGKDSWKSYPADMLKARARARALGVAFADALMGMPVDTDGDAFENDKPRQVVLNNAPAELPSGPTKLDDVPDEGQSVPVSGEVVDAPKPNFNPAEIAKAMDKPKPIFDLDGNPQ